VVEPRVAPATCDPYPARNSAGGPDDGCHRRRGVADLQGDQRGRAATAARRAPRMSAVAFWTTKAFRDTPCQGLRRSTGPCTTPALYVIHIGDIVYPVCGEHLRAFEQDVGLPDE
jgi:hypothetical protein